MSGKKANVLLVGGGAVGAIAALNIEVGGLGEVTAVLRSNFNAVQENGYVIESVDHGKLIGWRPTKGMRHWKVEAQMRGFDRVQSSSLDGISSRRPSTFPFKNLTNLPPSGQPHPRHHRRVPSTLRLHPHRD